MLLDKSKEPVHGRIGRRSVQSFIAILCNKFVSHLKDVAYELSIIDDSNI